MAPCTWPLWSMILLGLYFQTVSAQGNCSSPLGMENGAIGDNQITCFPTGTCRYARLNRARYGWISYRSTPTAYSKVDLLTVKRIARIAMQSWSVPYFTRQYRVYYSTDGLIWNVYKHQTNSSFLGVELPGNTGPYSTVEKYLNPPIQARYVALNPTNYSGYPAMRYELYGCDAETTFQTTFTNLTADIRGDIVWLNTLSPYVVNRTITIRPGASLTIQAGVRILFTNSDAKLMVFGNLRSEGVGSLRVVMSHNTIPLGNPDGLWGGIEVAEGGELSLTKTDIWQAGTGIRGPSTSMELNDIGVYVSSTGLDLTSGSINRTGSVFTAGYVYACNNGAILNDQGTVSYYTFNRYHIFRNQGYGIAIRCQHLKCGLSATYSSFSLNRQYGIHSFNQLVSLEMYHVTVEDNTRNGIRLNSGVRSSFVVSFSTIKSNGWEGVYLGDQSSAANMYFVLNNTFDSNNGGAIWMRAHDVGMSGNVFTNNGRKVLELHSYIEGNCNVTENMFDENYVGVYIDSKANVTFMRNVVYRTQTQYAVYLNSERVIFAYNEIVNSSSSVAVFVRSLTKNFLAYNIFFNPESDYEIESTVPFSEADVVLAPYNYWGSDNASYISSRVKDVFVDMDIARLVFSPFFTTRDLNELSTVYDGNAFTRDKYFNIGGLLVEDVVLERNRSFTVSRVIYVPVDITLTIEAGVELRFLSKRGIYARGTVKVLGQEDSKVIFSGKEGQRWSGIRYVNTSCSVSFAAVDNVQSSCFSFTDMRDVSLSSVSITGGDIGIGITSTSSKSSDLLPTFSTMSFQDVHISRIREGIRIVTEGQYTTDIELQRSSITFSSRHGIYITIPYTQRSSSIRIKSCDFTGNYRLLQASRSYSVNIHFEDCRFTSASRYGIDISDMRNSSFSIVNSVFISFRRPVYLHYRGECQNLIIQNNTFQSTVSQEDIYVYASFSGSNTNCSMEILENMFWKTTATRRGGVYISTNYGPGKISVKNNQMLGLQTRAVYIYTRHRVDSISVSDNTFADCESAISVTRYNGAATMRIERNAIYRNFKTDIISLNAYFIKDNPAVFSDNIMENNTNSVVKLLTPHVVLNYNVFNNPDSTYDLDLSASGSSSTGVNASLNYWGNVDSRQIERKIYDQRDNPNKPMVLFRPYFANDSFSAIYEETLNFVFVTPDGQIGGQVVGNVTLSLDGSPYTAVGDIEIEPGSTLEVEAGVQIKFLSNIEVLVKGTLVVNEENGPAVEFLSETPGQKWRGIKFTQSDKQSSRLKSIRVNDTTDGIQIHGNPPEMESVSVLYSSNNGFEFVQPIVHKAVSIRGLTALYNDKAGIRVDLGEWEPYRRLLIAGCSVQNNTELGIRVENNGQLEVTDCVVSGSTTGISLVDTTNGSVIFRSCSFYQHAYMLNLPSTYRTRGKFSFLLENSLIHSHYQRPSWWGYYGSLINIDVHYYITESTWNFIGNQFYDLAYRDKILDLNCQIGGSCMMNISDNTFVNCSSQAINFRSGTASTANIVGNRFENVINFEETPIVEIFLHSSVLVLISDNIFLNNKGSSVLLISGNKVESRDMRLISNEFVNNTVANVVHSSHATGIIALENVFVNPDASCELRAPEFVDSSAINAKHSYWGFREFGKILPRVCGYEKDMALSRVDILPYLLSANKDDVLDYDGEFVVDSLAGGVVSKSMTISARSQPYLISRSIYIGPGVELRIEPGTIVEFLENCGISVKGDAMIGSDNGSLTILRSSNSTSWSGIRFLSTESKAPGTRPETFNEPITTPRPKPDDKVRENTESTVKPDGTVKPPTPVSMSYMRNVVVDRSHSGLVLSRPQIAMYNNSILKPISDGITIKTENAAFDFNGTIVAESGNNGLYARSSVGISVNNLTITRSSGIGIYFELAEEEVKLDHLTLDNNTNGGALINFQNGTNKFFTLSHSTITNHRDTAVKVEANMRYISVTLLNITKNVFLNNIKGAFSVQMASSSSWVPNARNRSCNITENTFINNGANLLRVENYATVNVSNNKFEDSKTTEDCALTVESSKWSYNSQKLITVSTNRFDNGQGPCAVRLSSEDNENMFGSFIYNQILSTYSSAATILLDSLHYNLTDNILDNPTAVYEITVLKEGEPTINATRNWWGSADAEEARKRVYDREDRPSLLAIMLKPVRQELTFDCTQVNNCSNQGKCVRLNRCRCNSGWTGSSCAEHDCAGVSECSGRGTCIGPNLCECNQGYKGKRCELATCFNVNDCSERGYCVAPDTCTCFLEFSGPSCSSCAADRWGDDCKPCPFCVRPQGNCNLQTGFCMCDNNWTGELCQRCAETFYGPRCEPWVTVLNVFPNAGVDTGGTEVHVRGHNFPETANNTYYCRFRSTVVQGFRVSREHVRCVVPQLPEGSYIVEISPDGETDFTNNRTAFSVYAKCPPNACGKNLNPAHGSCAFGGCLCSLPWSGDDCMTEIIAPSIADIDEVNIHEGDRFVLNLELIQGTTPVSWFIQNPPLDMALDVRSASITWERSVGSYNPYQIVIGARNVVGTDRKTLIINVPLSYNVTIDSILPSGILPSPKPVTIKGHVEFVQNVNNRAAPVDLWIRNGQISGNNGRRISTFTTDGLFEVTFYHQPTDSGEFTVSGNHPSDPVFRRQGSWTVQGLKCSPLPIRLSGYLDAENVTFFEVSGLLNTGDNDVRNIRTEVLGIGSRLQAVEVVSSFGSSGSAYFLSVIQPGVRIPFNVKITASGPLQGTIALVFTSELGTTTTCYASIALSIRKPHFAFTPSILRDDLLIGTQRSYQLEITNDGEAQANNIVVSLPQDDRFSVVAFTKVTTGSLPEEGDGNEVSLLKEQSAVLSLSITSLKTDTLGEIKGRIAINSDEVSAVVPYHINLVSDSLLNLTVTVEDEFTYFDDSHPLVSGAIVTLINRRQGLEISLQTTNETGWVTFENINEDKYDLRVTGPSHGAYAAVIIANSATSEITVFLQRTAVTYTFSVTPTTFEDRYVISLETTFEAQVPMPVVTIEPAQINTIPYEEGRKNLIEFRLTNHGLIRAENVRFELPNHPDLIFYRTIENIGNLEANTSIIVPVRVERRAKDKTTSQAFTTVSPRTIGPHRTSSTNGSTARTQSSIAPTAKPNIVKRAATQNPNKSGFSCAIVVVYHYVCGVLRSRRITISLTKSYLGRPPMPCFLPVVTITYVGGRGRRFSGSGGLIVYIPMTPISCNCLKTYIENCIPFGGCATSALEGSVIGVLEKCILPVLPISGCAKSVIGAASPKTSFLDVVFSIIDIAMSCVVSTLCPVCGPIWNLIKCLVKVAITCSLGGIGKRDVSSAVMGNLIMKSGPMDNFLEMSVGIFGSQAMLELPDNSWYFKFKTSVAEDSPGESYLTSAELGTVLAGVNDTGSRETIRAFLLRWNNTVATFNDGTIGSRPGNDNVIPYQTTQDRYEQYALDSDAAKKSGFDTIFDEFDNAVGIYIDGKKQEDGGTEEGVCAKVRVKIVQDLVLTRDAFNARLEIENGEQSALTNVEVVLSISPSFNPGEDATDKFAIGAAELVGLTAVDGTGSLQRSISGSADWLIVPYSNAAIREDTQYDVGGSFSYSVGSSSLIVSLLPDKITVKPNPNLEVHYFHEKFVEADDPFTDEVEPSVPFVLAVMITNTGYGIAKSVKITSAQPEIVENEKGLLVNFKITGTALNGKPIPYSLTVDFGDIGPFETTVARWYLTSPLKGLFYNYSATFENINPLGDPQLSILDVLKSHELIHTVRVDFPEDDDLDDFLVTDELDAADLADHVFDSSSGLGTRLVESTVKEFAHVSESRQSGIYTFANLSCNVSRTGWFYARIETDLAAPDTTNGQLLAATRGDGKEILLHKNTWTTDHYRDATFFHLFDYSEDNSSLVNYTVVFGPPNLFDPVFNQSSDNVRVKFPLLSLFTTVFVAQAFDQDGGLVTYSHEPGNTKFAVNEESGAVYNTEIIETAQTFVVIARDDGIPQRSSSTILRVVSHSEVLSTTASTTTSATTTTQKITTPTKKVTTSSHLTLNTSTTSTSTDLSSLSTPTAVTPNCTQTGNNSTDNNCAISCVPIGVCMCDNNWTGELCQRCAETFYGPRCEPWVTVLNVFPNAGVDTGGTEVHVKGHNFPETANNTYFCRFRSTVVQGFRVSREHVKCVLPQLPEGSYIVEISPDGETDFTNNRTAFTVYAKCPRNACGKNLNPAHGSCAFGGCLCSLPWSGDDCMTEIIAPSIADIDEVNIQEGDRFVLNLELIQGTTPVSWFIQNPPLGMALDVRSAIITWERSAGSYNPYQIVIGARNVVGTDRKTLIINVPLSYNVTIDSIEPSGILPSPKPVTIKGHVEFLQNVNNQAAPVDLWIRKGEISGNNGRRISTFTTDGLFEVTFYHQPTDSGEFAVSGNHPSDPVFRRQGSWTVQGLKCSPLPIRLSGYLDAENVTFFEVSGLLNTGDNDVRNIRTEVLGIGSRLQAVEVVPSRGSSGSTYFLSVIQPGVRIPFNVKITASGPLQGTIALVFTSELGTTTTCYASIALSIRKPHFAITPSALMDDLLIGTQRSYQLEITNDGEAQANNIVVSLPQDDRFSVVAFTKVTTGSLPEEGEGNEVSLLKEQSAVLILSITFLKTDTLGEIKGRIAINSEEVSAVVPYHINLVSDSLLNLTVTVEDEFTYFDDSHPLVSGAIVTLINRRQGLEISLQTTNETGWVTFENIKEDKYDLRVTGPSHGAYAAVIIANSATSEITVFLQRTAVTYTFSVTPTTFEDRYVISLETTFEAQVPMPVVTIEPAQINTIPYEEGRKNLIEFRLTNHGLIRAENVRFELPNHPDLIFYRTIENIGNLEANTSIIVPVRVERREKDKTTSQAVTTVSPRTIGPHRTSSTNRPTGRTASTKPATAKPSTVKTVATQKPTTTRPNVSGGSGFSCAIVVVYHYVCGVLRSRRITISLTKSYLGRPPMPCFLPVVTITYVGGGGGGFSGSGGLIVYNPVTPISCNCLKTYIGNCIPFGRCATSALEGSVIGVLEKCILPVLPISACAKSVIRGPFPKKSFLDVVFGIIDIAMSCVVSTLCPICGPIWNLIKCLVKVAITCGLGGIGKRDVSSAVMENLIMKSGPMDNFLEMSVGIFGSQAMLELPDNSWYFKFKTSVAEDSPGESYLKSAELDTVLAGVNDTGSRETIRAFLLRWNNTVATFNDGTIGSRPANDNVIPYQTTQDRYEQYALDSDAAKKSGFDTIFDEFDNAVGIYIDGKKQEDGGTEEGVCAKVRVKIVQDLVLTRDAFNARLEIENGEQSALTNVEVVLSISPSFNQGEDATEKFAIGEAELVGLTAVDGTGSLQRSISGSSDWLIVPYSNAAIREDTQYDVGGSFSYSVGSSSLTVSLLPDTITVKPNPNLEVHYFHEKFVQADDPFTDEVEPSVPFVLAVMITNTGYGIAKSVKITSAQPEIVENEKGLLVNFKITGTALNGKHIPYSLTVDFGDIDPFETTVARWYLTSTLKGLFYNYSATFENINPLGDPQLSILDVLKSHELIHTVRVDFPEDDDLDDFLVNDELDATDLADHVFDSSSGLGTRLVESTVKEFAYVSESRQSGIYTFANLSCNVSRTGWFYARIETDLAAPDTTNGQLLAASRGDGKEILLHKNTWTTDHYGDAAFFHLFDYSEDDSSLVNYTVVFGPPNLFDPKFNQSSYNVSVKFPLLSLLTTVFVAQAFDQDGGLVTYSHEPGNTKFAVKEESGAVYNTEIIETAQTFVVIAQDDGIPQRSSSTILRVISHSEVLSSTASTTTRAATTQKITTPIKKVTNSSHLTLNTTSTSTDLSSVSYPTPETPNCTQTGDNSTENNCTISAAERTTARATTTQKITTPTKNVTTSSHLTLNNTSTSTDLSSVSTPTAVTQNCTQTGDNSTDNNCTISAAEQQSFAYISVFLPIAILILGIIALIN